jgi:hypothetical protein
VRSSVRVSDEAGKAAARGGGCKGDEQAQGESEEMGVTCHSCHVLAFCVRAENHPLGV